MDKTFTLCVGIIVSLQAPLIFADSTYNYLCGTDEDSCIAGQPNTCVCVSDLNVADHCLDLNKGVCDSVNSTTGQCAAGQHDYATRTACLTILWQSSISANPAINCVPFSAHPAAQYCASKCTNLFDCQHT